MLYSYWLTAHPNALEEVDEHFSALEQQANQLPEAQRLLFLTALDSLNTVRQSLLNQQQLLQTVLQASPMAVSCLDTGGRVILWNPAAEAIFGWRADEVIGKTVPVIGCESQPEFWAYHQAILSGHSPVAVRLHCQSKTGRRITVTLSAAPLAADDGTIGGVVNFFGEVAEDILVEETRNSGEEKFRSIVEQSTDGIVLLDDQGVIVEWNKAQEQNTGIVREQAIGQFIWDVQHQLVPRQRRNSASLEANKQRIRQLLETHDAAWLNRLSEVEFERPDGTHGFLQSLSFPIYSSGGFMVGSISRDVTQQKRTEEALRESEERFRAVFESAQDAIYIKNRDLIYTHVNRIVEKQNNKSTAEIIGKTAEDLFEMDSATAAQIREIDLRVLAGEVVEQISIRSTGGIPRTYHSFKVPIRDKSGEIIGLCGFARDITERQCAEEELRESEERYRALVNNSPVGIYVLQDGHYIFSNPAGAHLLNLASPDEIIGKRGHEHIAPGDQERIRRFLEASPRQTIPPMEITLNRADGTSIVVESTAVPIKLNGKYTVLVISQDITERKLAQEQALALDMERQHSQLLTDFIQNVSHEFRTPLSIINTNLYLLSKMVDSPRQVEKLRRVETQSQQITELIQAMLTMSRLDRGIPLSYKTSDINQLIKDILVCVQPLAEKKQLAMQCDFTDQPLLQCDLHELHAALLSIFENALIFSEVGGTITTHIAGDTDQVSICIQDTGGGIEAVDLPHVFERFYRADKARSTRGAGLGLSIAKKIVERHHGTIRIDSALGQGTTVTITLPREQAE